MENFIELNNLDNLNDIESYFRDNPLEKYQRKSDILKLNYCGIPLIDWIKKCSLYEFNKDSEYAISKKTYKEIRHLITKLGIVVEKECIRINKAYYEKTNRLKQRVAEIITTKDSIFLTLTFTDKILNHTLAKSRRDYIRKFLKQFNCKYVANIDFGKVDDYIDDSGIKRKGTHREHYHALIQTDFIDNKLYKYGAISFERIHNTKDPTKLAKYIAKLSNHAIKESTKRSVLIYSR